MTIKKQDREVGIQRGSQLMAAAGILGALAASSCCILPLYWLVYRPSRLVCGDGEACRRPLPNRLVKAGLIVATIVVLAGIGFDFVGPLLLNS